VLDVREYVDADGGSPFTKWLRALNVQAAAKVATALERIADGNLSNAKGVGGGVLEYRIDFGPATAFISDETADASSFRWPVARRNASNGTSGRRK
jgi:hypothetical protein